RGHWIFTNARGAPLHPHEQQSPNGTYLDHLTQIDTETGLLGPAPPQPSPPRARFSPPRGRGEGSTHRASNRPGRSTRPASTHRARTRTRTNWTQDDLLTSPEPPFSLSRRSPRCSPGSHRRVAMAFSALGVKRLRAQAGDLVGEVISLGAHHDLDDPAGTYYPKGAVFTQRILIDQRSEEHTSELQSRFDLV